MTRNGECSFNTLHWQAPSGIYALLCEALVTQGCQMSWLCGKELSCALAKAKMDFMHFFMHLTFPKQQILDSFKLNELAPAEDNFKNGRKFSKRVENISTMENGKIACYEQFLLFPQCFLKDLHCRHVKSEVCFRKGYTKQVILSLSHNPTFNDSEKKVFWKHCGKRRKCWIPAFSSFPTMFSTLSKTKIIILANFTLASANAFNLDQTEICCLVKG